MARETTTGIVLRRREYGDFDLIVTLLTMDRGKCTLIAKAAKKSKKRFPGILEPFNRLRIAYRQGRRKGMAFLEEASLDHSLGGVRSDFIKTAYASYWAECILLWMEEERVRPDIFELLAFVLGALADGRMPAEILSIHFQMRFVGYEGLQPVLDSCADCQSDIATLVQSRFCVDLGRGGVVCQQCPSESWGRLHLSKGTLKQLAWIAKGDLNNARRIRFSAQATAEATTFLEAFVPYHLGRQLKSLKYLQQIRG